MVYTKQGMVTIFYIITQQIIHINSIMIVKKLTWNIGVLGEIPLYTSEPTPSIDVFKAEWDDTTLSITSIIEESVNTNKLVRDRVDTLLSNSRCNTCGLFVCCCDLDEQSVDDSDLKNQYFHQVVDFLVRVKKRGYKIRKCLWILYYSPWCRYYRSRLQG